MDHIWNSNLKLTFESQWCHIVTRRSYSAMNSQRHPISWSHRWATGVSVVRNLEKSNLIMRQKPYRSINPVGKGFVNLLTPSKARTVWLDFSCKRTKPYKNKLCNCSIPKQWVNARKTYLQCITMELLLSCINPLKSFQLQSSWNMVVLLWGWKSLQSN